MKYYTPMTRIHSRNPEVLQKLLHKIETEGTIYGLSLNYKKCEHMAVGPTRDIRFKSGTTVNKMNESKYLGCYLNNRTDITRELKRRMGDVWYTWKRLELFWKMQNATLGLK